MKKKTAALLTLTTLLATMLMGFSLPTAGAPTTGTILVSEEYTPSEYSYNSPYFGPFNSLLIAQGYTVTVSTSTVTPSLLIGVDVLIVNLPTTQYGTSEIDAIQAFVSGGGGLFCIAEHTTTWRVDDIIARWGFSQATAYVTDSDNHVAGTDYWVYYEAARGNFATHPITTGLTRVQSACSNWFLDTLPPTAVSVITTDTDGTASPSGVSVYAALDTGTGRIAISMDSNYFGPSGDPTYGLDIDDNADLGLNTVAWLMPEQRQLIATGSGVMWGKPPGSVRGPAELYMIGEVEMELVITYKGEEHSGTWEIMDHYWKYRWEVFECYNPDYGFFKVQIDGKTGYVRAYGTIARFTGRLVDMNG